MATASAGSSRNNGSSNNGTIKFFVHEHVRCCPTCGSFMHIFRNVRTQRLEVRCTKDGTTMPLVDSQQQKAEGQKRLVRISLTTSTANDNMSHTSYPSAYKQILVKDPTLAHVSNVSCPNNCKHPEHDNLPRCALIRTTGNTSSVYICTVCQTMFCRSIAAGGNTTHY